MTPDTSAFDESINSQLIDQEAARVVEPSLGMGHLTNYARLRFWTEVKHKRDSAVEHDINMPATSAIHWTIREYLSRGSWYSPLHGSTSAEANTRSALDIFVALSVWREHLQSPRFASEPKRNDTSKED